MRTPETDPADRWLRPSEPDVDEVHAMRYGVHPGRRYTPGAVVQGVDDRGTEHIDVLPCCQPLHQPFAGAQQGLRRGDLPLTGRSADRALALPLHGRLQADHVAFIVQSLKHSTVNVGAGAADC